MEVLGCQGLPCVYRLKQYLQKGGGKKQEFYKYLSLCTFQRSLLYFCFVMCNFILSQEKRGWKLVKFTLYELKHQEKTKINKYVGLGGREFQIKASFTEGRVPKPARQAFIIMKMIS